MNHPFNVIVYLLKQYNEAIQSNNLHKAFELAVDITEQAQKLEDVTEEAVNAH